MLEIVSLSTLTSPLSIDLTIIIMLLIASISYLKRYRDFDAILLSLTITILTRLGLSEVLLTSIFILIGHRFVRGSISSLAIYFSLSILYLSYLNIFLNWSFNYMILLALVSSLSASLMESIDARPLLIILTVSTTLAVFHVYALDIQFTQIALAFLFSFLLSFLALKFKIADESGLMSATLIGVITIVYSDIRYFLTLLVFYVLGSAITKYKYGLKLERGIAEQSGGARGFANVFSNSLPALFFAMNYGVFKNEVFTLAFVASISTALGDTMASEVGKTADKVYLITNFRLVEPGTSGGVSMVGEISALIGCSTVSAFAMLMGLIDVRGFIISTLLGFFGVHIDSILGATLERMGYLNNSGVNFISTLSSGLLSLVAY